MHRVLQGLIGNGVTVYMDDILVYTPLDPKGHVKLVRAVLGRLAGAGLRLKPSKCVLMRSEVVYIGHLVRNGTISPAHSNVQAVLNFKNPDNAGEVRSFLGLAAWYRRFVKGYASIALLA